VAVDVRHPASVELAKRRSPRARAIGALGPLTVVGGVAWIVVQPYRITLFDLDGQGFWWLLVEPPLLVIAVGVVFHLLVARPLIEDLEQERD
jgi:hypothetical protein